MSGPVQGRLHRGVHAPFARCAYLVHVGPADDRRVGPVLYLRQPPLPVRGAPRYPFLLIHALHDLIPRETPMLRYWKQALFILFLFMVVNNPQGAANLVHSAGNGVAHIAGRIGQFFVDLT